MRGLMQCRPLLVSSIITHAAREHGAAEVVSRPATGPLLRADWAGIERRARRLARVLGRLGVGAGDRVATLAWNGQRHLELFYAVSGAGAVCHTVNPRLSPDDITYIITHAEDRALFLDTDFAPLVAELAPRLAACVRDVVVLAGPGEMPALDLAAGMRLHCYEALMDEADEDYEWPVFDETAASSLCYTSGTTGRPKGVLYSHRSTVLHAMATNAADAFGLRAVDRAMPVAPMFHANAWAIPYSAPMAGAALILPGRQLDGASLAALLDAERVTIALGVPTVWLGLLAQLRATGTRLATLARIGCGGSAVPESLIEAYAREQGVEILQAWGMTETSPLATCNRPNAATADETGAAALRRRAKQGRPMYGVELRVRDAEGREPPRDGRAFGDVYVRGNWVASGYYRRGEEGGADAEGWFPTGDVATVDPEGFLELVDRSKDVIKSGGEWISSIQLENIAVSHPDVAEAAVIAVPDPKWMERPLLIVTAKPGRAPTEAELLAIYRGRVPSWCVPDRAITVDELPHTATGKLNKLELRRRYAGAQG